MLVIAPICSPPLLLSYYNLSRLSPRLPPHFPPPPPTFTNLSSRRRVHHKCRGSDSFLFERLLRRPSVLPASPRSLACRTFKQTQILMLRITSQDLSCQPQSILRKTENMTPPFPSLFAHRIIPMDWSPLPSSR